MTEYDQTDGVDGGGGEEAQSWDMEAADPVAPPLDATIPTGPTAAPARPAFAWAQQPWYTHLHGHELAVAWTLRNDGGSPGTVQCHVVVSNHGAVVHVEDRHGPGPIQPGFTWDDQLTVQVHSDVGDHVTDISVTSAENPDFGLTARVDTGGAFG